MQKFHANLHAQTIDNIGSDTDELFKRARMRTRSHLVRFPLRFLPSSTFASFARFVAGLFLFLPENLIVFIPPPTAALLPAAPSLKIWVLLPSLAAPPAASATANFLSFCCLLALGPPCTAPRFATATCAMALPRKTTSKQRAYEGAQASRGTRDHAKYLSRVVPSPSMLLHSAPGPQRGHSEQQNQQTGAEHHLQPAAQHGTARWHSPTAGTAPQHVKKGAE
jgi:hypothetical protein